MSENILNSLQNILKEILEPLEMKRLSLEMAFFDKLEKIQNGAWEVETQEKNYLKAGLNQDDLKRETHSLTLYAPDEKGEKRELFLKRLEELSVEPEFIPASIKEWEDNPRVFEIEIFPQKGPQPQRIILKFKHRSLSTGFTIHVDDEKIHINQSPNLESLLQVAACLSRWPFLVVDEVGSPPKHADQEIFDLPFYKKRHYFNQILLGRRPSAGLLFLDRVGLLSKFLPELTEGRGLRQNRFHAYDIFEHSIRALDGVIKADPVLRWSALLHDVGKVPTRKVKENGEASFYNHELHSARMVVPVMKRIGVPKVLGQRVRFLVRNHMFHYTHEWTDKAIRRFIRKIDQKDLEDLIHLRLADRKGSGKKTSFPRGLQMLMEHIHEVREKEKEFKIRDLKINGNDLISLGLSPGPVIGQILKRLMLGVKEEALPNHRDTLLEEAQKML